METPRAAPSRGGHHELPATRRRLRRTARQDPPRRPAGPVGAADRGPGPRTGHPRLRPEPEGRGLPDHGGRLHLLDLRERAGGLLRLRLRGLRGTDHHDHRGVRRARLDPARRGAAAVGERLRDGPGDQRSVHRLRPHRGVLHQADQQPTAQPGRDRPDAAGAGLRDRGRRDPRPGPHRPAGLRPRPAGRLPGLAAAAVRRDPAAAAGRLPRPAAAAAAATARRLPHPAAATAARCLPAATAPAAAARLRPAAAPSAPPQQQPQQQQPGYGYPAAPTDAPPAP